MFFFNSKLFDGGEKLQEKSRACIILVMTVDKIRFNEGKCNRVWSGKIWRENAIAMIYGRINIDVRNIRTIKTYHRQLRLLA